MFRKGWWSPRPFPKNYEIAHIKLGAEVEVAVTLKAFSVQLCPFGVHNSRDTQQKDVDDNDDGGDKVELCFRNLFFRKKKKQFS